MALLFELLPLLAAAGVLGVVLLVRAALQDAARRRRSRLLGRIHRRERGAGAAPAEAALLKAGQVEATGGPRRVEQWRIQAGGPGPTVLWLQVGLAALVGTLAVGALLGLPAALGGLLLGLLPLGLLRRRANAAAEALSAQLPQGLDLVGRSLKSGHSLSEALRVGASELAAPLGLQLQLVSEEVRMGADVRTALGGLVSRNPLCFDLRMFAGAVSLQRETGASLTEMIGHLAELIRERQVFKGKVAALTAEVRMSARILGSLPFAVAGMLLAMRPGYLLPLVQTELGQQMLTVGAVSMVVGAVLMRRLTQVEL